MINTFDVHCTYITNKLIRVNFWCVLYRDLYLTISIILTAGRVTQIVFFTGMYSLVMWKHDD